MYIYASEIDGIPNPENSENLSNSEFQFQKKLIFRNNTGEISEFGISQFKNLNIFSLIFCYFLVFDQIYGQISG